MSTRRRRILSWSLGASAVLALAAVGLYAADRVLEHATNDNAVRPTPAAGSSTVPVPGTSDEQPPAPPSQPPATVRPSAPPPPPATSQPGPPPLPDSLVGTEWERLPTTRKVVALTFDCGANAAGIPSVLRTLRATETPATFFVTGRWAEAFGDDAREIGTRYPVGNHTYSHPDLTGLNSSAVVAEVAKADSIIRRTTGRDPRPLFRFPYGARDERTIRLVNDLQYGSIRWTVDTLGWKGTAGGQTAESVRARVLSTLRPGAIVLMHVGSAPDGSTLDADALPSIVEAVRARGYRFVDLTGFLAAA